MTDTQPTPDRGLYRDEFERDSCGFGLIANMDDQPSHCFAVIRRHISSNGAVPVSISRTASSSARSSCRCQGPSETRSPASSAGSSVAGSRASRP